jgi:hypothetical protein
MKPKFKVGDLVVFDHSEKIPGISWEGASKGTLFRLVTVAAPVRFTKDHSDKDYVYYRGINNKKYYDLVEEEIRLAKRI